MTIKQQGGIFGRNPTFNDVEVEGSLTAQSPTFTGDMSVDGTTLFVDASSNRVGLGTSSPAAAFHIEQGSPIIQFEDTDAGGVYSQINGSGTAGRLLFNADATNAGANTTIQFNIDGAEAASFNPSGLAFPNGKGIDFSATAGTGTSELFNDYEEGTWTATVGCSGNATETTTATAFYTKIGRQVTVSFRSLNNIDTTGLSGFLLIKGLPYACVSGATAGFSGSVVFKALTYPANTDAIFPTTSNGASTIIFELMGDGATPTFLIPSSITSGTTDIAYLTLTYFTA